MRAAVAAGVVLLGLTACRADRAPYHAATEERAPRVDPAVAVCDVVAAPWDEFNPVRELAQHGSTFVDLVAQDHRTALEADVTAAIYLARNPIFAGDDGYVGMLGPYEAAIAYLDQRSVAWDPEYKSEGLPMPPRTKAVVESAERLDRDLTHGLCTAGRRPPPGG